MIDDDVLELNRYNLIYNNYFKIDSTKINEELIEDFPNINNVEKNR